MNVCCNQTMRLGCYPHCGTIDTGLTAPEAGIWRVLWHSNGNSYEMTLALNANQHILLPNVFNESSEVVFRLYRPTGNLFTFTTNNNDEYDCFSFITTIRFGV